LAQAYDVDGVPTLGVHGRFYTGGALAGDNVRALAVAEVLIDRVRRNV
jgi:thiol:disulfide interchange protein DsbA